MIKKAYNIEIPEQVKEDLKKINSVSEDLGMKIYVVGGFVRDIISGKKIDEKKDIDITEIYGNSFDLAFFIAAKYNLKDPKIYESSGTAMIIMPSGRVVEFHNSNYKITHIIDQLYLMDIEPTPINKDVYSRDFTINTVLFDPVSEEIVDITKRGVDDILNKVLRTPLDPYKSLEINPTNILRGIRFKLEYDLNEDPEYTKAVPNFIPWLIDYLKNNPDSKVVSKNVFKAYELNPKLALEEFKKIGIYDYIPKTGYEEKIIKEELFGTTIIPQSVVVDKIIMKEMGCKNFVVTAQTSMIRWLINERNKHKTYIKRKRREEKERRKKEIEILEKARNGYYLERGEDPAVFTEKKKDYMGIPGREFIPRKKR